MAKTKKQENKEKAPVVAILGHIDHGKSSILETIRDLRITAKESGGITQHIGAYQIEEDGEKITFIDTPGHEAFSAMRSRGAKVADVAILVVAADEGVKDQTEESISYIKEAGIPMIVAINKMDKPEADPKKVKRELAESSVKVEEMGGDIPTVETSAETKEGIDDLLEVILLVAEMEDLKTDFSKKGEGVVIESNLDSQRGPLATVILREGTLKRGDPIATNSTSGKVKIMEDSFGDQLEEVLPSQPALILGFSEVPRVGEKVKAFENLEEAREFQEEREEEKIDLNLEPGEKVLNLILKVDVLGSIEAIEQILENLPQEKVKIRILKSEVGDITEGDVKTAQTAKGSILGFRVDLTSGAEKIAEKTGVEIKTFDVIYDLVDEAEELMKNQLESEIIRNEMGRVKTLVIFKTSGSRQIVGGRITRGEVQKGALIDVIRDKKKVGSGKIVNLQKEKKDVERLVKGDECGILYEGQERIKKGDTLIIYTEEEKEPSLIESKEE